jgi:hypothetical protein
MLFPFYINYAEKKRLTIKCDILIGEIIQPTVGANCVRPQAFAERPTNKIICSKQK